MISNIEKHAKEIYVTKEEIKPIKQIVYGAVALVLSSVVIGGLSLIIINSK